MIRKLSIVSALAGAMLASWMAPDTAQARMKVRSAFGCHASGGNAIDSSFAVANDSTTSDLVLRCDVENSTEFLRGEFDSFVVHGRDGTTTGKLAAQACRSTAAVIGGACSPSVATVIADVKDEALSVDTGVWGGFLDGLDYGFIALRVPPKQGSSRSSINGFTYQD